ncbi:MULTISPECIES: hypothetical protein [Rhizobium/Agrobacterium group]|uniref:hypothetical protein n=1 Tax=Rhizobium/Agrobacterium group TaxID=227290 RepID=UPI00107F7545|nr:MULTISPECIES: hypothetical protein [Rhizobium/Agrobacterium group]MBB4402998.1 hypothetical protein [Agrobacterium radiobacter]MBB5589092.1 hypothetical protein [Agrobacterium radiobacter]TGE86063.1 hypothetical protein C9418_24510 [Rhizobium sp. SEMIA 4032]
MQTRLKPRPGEKRQHVAHSLYSAKLGAHDEGRYRVTPSCAPAVPALVRPGMAVRTSYGTGGIVIVVEGPVVYQAADGREYEHFTIVYVPTARFGHHSTADHRWINECVAVGGRILMLFEANSDEVFVEAAAAGPP